MISFSGGRTSAFMLKQIVDAGIGPDVHILFANTGKEREETLEFVRDCAVNFGVTVQWLERFRLDGERAGYRVVGFNTASRNGEPFAALAVERKFLPNPVTRYCTTELKIRTIKMFMLDLGYEHWTNVVGLRADEPFRVSKQRNKEGSERWDLAFPLYDAGVSKSDVILFWKKQNFDLRLRAWEGNCDLCFLKGEKKRLRIMEDTPEAAAWWIEQELRQGATFRSDTASYAALLRRTQSQLRMFPNSLFSEEELENDPTDLDECGGYCESNREVA